jgi:hypothetical protein
MVPPDQANQVRSAAQFVYASLDLATTCASLPKLNAVTVYGDTSLTALFDDIVFVH